MATSIRKRHTARRVASTCSAVSMGGGGGEEGRGGGGRGGGTPSCPDRVVSHLFLPRGLSILSWSGGIPSCPAQGAPHPVLASEYPSYSAQWATPSCPGQGDIPTCPTWEYTILSWSGGTPFYLAQWGTPSCPGWGYPILSWLGGTPSSAGQGTPCLRLEYPPSGTGNPSPGTKVPLQKGHETRHWGTPGKDMGPVDGSIMGWRWGTRPLTKQTHTCENSTFPFLRNAGGKNCIS